MTTQDAFVDDNNRLIAAPTPRWMHSPKRIRVLFNGQTVADSTNAHLLREGGPPVYYFPEADVRMDLLANSTFTKDSPIRGNASYFSLTVDGRTSEDAAYTYREPVETAEFLRSYVVLDWSKMDAWFEEKEEVFVHARDPFKRIDTVKTDRHIQIVVNGETVADSTGSVMLLEPGHPVRYYLPMADVRPEVLRPSETVSRCPYKGAANYFSIAAGGQVLADAAWEYRYPTPESGKVMGMLCFFNERVDAIIVDGEELAKPLTNWGR
jgi:uncharacterized protein (DUF427 family)